MHLLVSVDEGEVGALCLPFGLLYRNRTGLRINAAGSCQAMLILPL
jgi:hypothetical protein